MSSYWKGTKWSLPVFYVSLLCLQKVGKAHTDFFQWLTSSQMLSDFCNSIAMKMKVGNVHFSNIY